MSEGSLYRRHRPQAFAEVVGQEHVVRTLANAVERDRVHHAYLFVGSRGTGKTSLAKILARSLNCERGPTLEPCGECESCRSIAAGTSLDVIEMDAASNRSVDDIRDLRERVGYAPAAGRWKVYILDEAHMLTREAWNAFLKTLEEPPPNTAFVLCTTEPQKVMPTIVDRCQRFDFQRPSLEQIAEVLRRVAASESIEIEDGAVSAIARAATGSFRDALSTLDQLVSYGGPKVATDDVLAVLGVAEADLILESAGAIASEDGAGAIAASEKLARSGRDVAQFGRDLLAHLRQLLVVRTVGAVPDSFSVTATDPAGLTRQAQAFADIALVRAIDSIAAALAAIKEGDDPRMTMELALLRAARPELDPSNAALMQRLERLERSLGGGPAIAAPAPSTPAEQPQAVAEPVEEAAPSPDDAPAAPQSTAEAAQEETPVAQAAAAAAAMDIEQLRELWPAVVDQVRHSGSELLSTVFAAARPVALDIEGAVLQVGFPPSAAFNKRKAEAQEARERFTDALRTIAGKRLKPVFVLLEREPDDAVVEEKLSDEELLERLKSEFDAEEVFGEDDGKENETANDEEEAA